MTKKRQPVKKVEFFDYMLELLNEEGEYGDVQEVVAGDEFCTIEIKLNDKWHHIIIKDGKCRWMNP